MKIETLDRIKLVENDHTLKILVINADFDIQLSDLIEISKYGNAVIAVDNPINMSFLVGKLCGIKSVKVVLLNHTPIEDYDIIIFKSYSNGVDLVLSSLKTHYVMFIASSNGFNDSRFSIFETNCFKLTSSSSKEIISNIEHHDNILKACPNDMNSNNQIDNDFRNYDIIVKNLASSEMVYGKYNINYLYGMVPGKASVIMIVSENNNKFAETIRALKTQNIEYSEYIIIDNAAGFRNNVKPNIRYGEKMPIDFCEYHAKELTSGEYIFILNQDSDEFDILERINNGQYETR